MPLKSPPRGSGLYKKKLSDGTEKYQSRLWSPPLGRIGKKHTWEEFDLNVVLQKHYQLKSAYQANNYDLITSKPKSEKLPELILPAAAMYERYLRDDLKYVPQHQKKNLDEKYIRNTVQYIRNFLRILQINHYKLSHTTLHAIDQDAVGIFYQHLQKRLESNEIGSVTFNKHIKSNREWFRYLQKIQATENNPFEDVKLKTERTDPQFITTQELNDLLEILSEENGYGYRGTSNKKVSYYRPWLKSYLLVSVFVGGRPDQVVNLRWRDWMGEYITLQNEKVNNLKKEKGNVVYVYIHPELAEILSYLSQGMKNQDDYILVPDHTNRNHLKNFVSRAFQHYWRQLLIDKKVTLNNLRHTYINRVLEVIGEDGIGIHHKKETAVRHYLSKKKRLKIEEGKSLFNININQILD